MKNIILLLLFFVTSSAAFSQMTKSEMEDFFRQFPAQPKDEITIYEGADVLYVITLTEDFRFEFRESGFFCNKSSEGKQFAILLQYSSIAVISCGKSDPASGMKFSIGLR